MKTLFTIIVAALLQGCLAATVVTRSDRTITIRDEFGGTDTQGMAQQHCAEQGRHAVFRQYVRQPSAQCYNGCQYFECVE